VTLSDSEHEEACLDVEKEAITHNMVVEKDRRVYDITFTRGHSAVFVTRLVKMFMPEYKEEILKAFDAF